jgi:hypothetical protein
MTRGFADLRRGAARPGAATPWPSFRGAAVARARRGAVAVPGSRASRSKVTSGSCSGWIGFRTGASPPARSGTRVSTGKSKGGGPHDCGRFSDVRYCPSRASTESRRRVVVLRRDPDRAEGGRDAGCCDRQFVSRAGRRRRPRSASRASGRRPPADGSGAPRSFRQPFMLVHRSQAFVVLCHSNDRRNPTDVTQRV